MSVNDICLDQKPSLTEIALNAYQGCPLAWYKHWKVPFRRHWLFAQKYKLASNNFRCICEQIWKGVCRMKACTTINMTKGCCFRVCVKLIITTKNFLPSLCLLPEWPSLVTCKHKADHFTPMMWLDYHQVTVPLHQGTVPLFWVHQILSKLYDTKQHFIWNS